MSPVRARSTRISSPGSVSSADPGPLLADFSIRAGRMMAPICGPASVRRLITGRSVQASGEVDLVRFPSASNAAVPLVSLIAPVAAVSFGEEDDTGQVLGALVAELDGRIHAGRRAVFGAEELAVLSVDDQGLRMHRALDVPALVVVGVEGLEVDVARIGGHPD